MNGAVERIPAVDTPEQAGLATSDFTPWFDAIDHASARTRWMTIVLTTASILTFVAAWNTMPHAWLLSRLRIQKAVRTYTLASTEAERCALLSGPDGDLYKRAETLIKAGDASTKHDFIRVPVEFAVISNGIVDTASAKKGQVEGPNPTRVSGHVDVDVSALEEQRKLAELDKKLLDDVKTIEVPVFGVVFDINDLGLLSGIAFVVILLMRKMSMNNEHLNLRATFLRALEKKCLRDTYELVAMRMVLTVPVRLQDRSQSPRSGIGMWFYRILAMSIDLAPIAMLLFIYSTNWQSHIIGEVVSPTGAMVSMAFTLVLLFATAGLTAVSIWTEFRVHRTFDVLASGTESEIRAFLSRR